MIPVRSLRALASMLFVGALGLITSPMVAHADSGDPKRATILVKAMSFDLDLDTRIGDAMVIAVIYKSGDTNSLAVANSWITAFAQLGSLRVKNAPLRAVLVPFDAAAIDEAVKKHGVDAVLVCDGLDNDLDEITRIALPLKLMTLGAKRSYVERGGGTVLGVFLEDDKPRIVVNLPAARKGGFRFGSAMLRLATLIK